MKQTTFPEGTFDRHREPTKGEVFLAELERVVPRAKRVTPIEPVRPKAGIGYLTRWLVAQAVHLPPSARVQPSDSAAEALYDSNAMHWDLGREPVPDETTLCRFRHLREEYSPGWSYLSRCTGIRRAKAGRCPLASLTIINAPSSTENQGKACDNATLA